MPEREPNGELPVILFKGISLKEWVDEVGGVEARGTTFGLNVGPFPRAPNNDTIKKFKPLLKMYGDITHINHLLRRRCRGGNNQPTMSLTFLDGKLNTPHAHTTFL